MKKLLAVVLSLMLMLSCVIPAFAAEKVITAPADAYVPYDAGAVAAGNTGDLSYDQLAGVALDWLDRRIADEAADFNAFCASVGVDLQITGVDSLIGMADHKDALGGDFANLDTSALVTREGGDINFIYGLIQFMADNADIFGKVFRWDEGVFDYGKVGEYIESLEDGDPIKKFYEDYLIGGDIQEKFVGEIAREMDYTPAEGETFDEIINNGVKAKVLEFAGDLLSEESKAAVNAMDLRTTDVYTLVKEFIGLLQNDHKAELDDVLAGMLQAIQGAVGVLKDAVNVEPPVVAIGDKTATIGTYTPADPDPASYEPTIYTTTQYKAAIESALGAEAAATVTDAALPEDVAALITGNGTAMDKAFVMTVTQGDEVLSEINLDFADIEALANQAAVTYGTQAAAASGGSVNSTDIQFAYTGYATESDFVMQVKVTKATANVTMTVPVLGEITQDIDVTSFIANPIATIVVRNLSGTIEELEEVQRLINAIDTEAQYDGALLDVMANYDAYKGAIGQVNRILCDALDMALTDEAYADLDLTEGGNEYLTANLQKLCDKVADAMAFAKKYVDRDTFISLADAANIGAGFASEHGFNAGMIYDMDFSSVENALVCGIRVGCDLLVADDPDSLLYDFHMRVEDLETLDAMTAAAADMILGKLIEKIDFEGFDYTYTAIDYAKVKEDGAEDAVMAKIVDVLYYTANWATDKINAHANSLIDKLNGDFDLRIGDVAFKLGVKQSDNWKTTLNALTDRFLQLTNGLLVVAGELEGMKDVWGKLNGITAAVLPVHSMFSNYTTLSAAKDAFFAQATDGDLTNLLKLFEVKEDALAGGVPVTMALINASEYIVDAFFKDTVNSEDYLPATLTTQEEFTGAANDAVIAANNMRSINARKAYLVPFALDLLRESGLLSGMACDHAHTEEIPAVAATCTSEGKSAGVKCADCGYVLTEQETLPKLNHGEDADGDGLCDFCGEQIDNGGEGDDNGSKPSGFAAFWQRIVDFFRRIGDFFRNLFNR